MDCELNPFSAFIDMNMARSVRWMNGWTHRPTKLYDISKQCVKGRCVFNVTVGFEVYLNRIYYVKIDFLFFLHFNAMKIKGIFQMIIPSISFVGEVTHLGVIVHAGANKLVAAAVFPQWCLHMQQTFFSFQKWFFWMDNFLLTHFVPVWIPFYVCVTFRNGAWKISFIEISEASSMLRDQIEFLKHILRRFRRTFYNWIISRCHRICYVQLNRNSS